MVRHRPEAFNRPGGFIYRSMRMFALRSVLACLREQFLFRPLIGLMSGLGLMVADKPELATIAWAAGVALILVVLLVEIVWSLAKGQVGLGIVAALSRGPAPEGLA